MASDVLWSTKDMEQYAAQVRRETAERCAAIAQDRARLLAIRGIMDFNGLLADDWAFYWDSRCTPTCECKNLQQALDTHPELNYDRDDPQLKKGTAK